MATTPRVNPGLEVIASDEGFVIHDADGGVVHYLNETAAIVYSLCDGSRDTDEIATLVGAAFDLPSAPVADVEKAVADLESVGALFAPS